MRLTPSRFRSSSDPSSDETTASTVGTEQLVDVTIYQNSTTAREPASAIEPEDVIPSSDDAFVTALERMNTPVTVDEITDQLLRPSRPPVSVWADIHEQLYQNRLPQLDTDGHIEFDPQMGTVDIPVSGDEDWLLDSSLGRISIGFLFAIVALLSLAFATAVMVTFMTVGV